jgi:hypothetical protein
MEQASPPNWVTQLIEKSKKGDGDGDEDDAVSKTMSTIEAIAASTVALVKKYYAWLIPLAVLYGVSIVLIAARGLFIAALPLLIKHYKLFTVWLNYLLIALNNVEMAIRAVVDLVKLGMQALQHTKHANINVDFHTAVLLSPKAVHRELNELLLACAGQHNGPKIFTTVVRTVSSPTVCPMIRALQPTWLATAARQSTTMLTYDVDPTDPHTCVRLYSNTLELTCAAIGSGFVLAEVVLPGIIAIVFLIQMAKLLLRLRRRWEK